jgi:hypothetical protein
VAPHVVDLHKRGGAITGTQGFVGKVVSSIVLVGEFVSRRNHCAQTTTFHRARRGREHTNATSILREEAATPMPFICDEGTSPFEDLYLSWSCRGIPLLRTRFQKTLSSAPYCATGGGRFGSSHGQCFSTRARSSSSSDARTASIAVSVMKRLICSSSSAERFS